MPKHTDFGRLGRGDQAVPQRRRDARAALFTEPAESRPADAAEDADAGEDVVAVEGATADEGVDAARGPRLSPVAPAGPDPASAPEPDTQPQPEPPDGALDAGWFVLECSACHTRSRMGLLALMFAAMPSVHLPLLRQDYPSLMRCPRCRAYRWVNVRLDLDL